MSQIKGAPTPADEPAFYEVPDDILNAIAAERDYQTRRWGVEADDTKNEPNDWVAYISHHATRWFSGGFAPYDFGTVEAFRAQMVKVAALAIAAIESIDRQRVTKGAAFFEKRSEA